MFKDAKELKSFILWAKTQKIKSFKIKDIEVELSELNFLPSVDDEPIRELSNITSDTLLDTEDEKTSEQEDDELLYWSTQ